MPLNTRKVMIGGVVAGTIIIILNILAQVVLGERVQHEMNAWLPGSADRMNLSVAALAAGIIMKFII